MKRFIQSVLFVLLSVVPLSAHATIARLAVLGSQPVFGQTNWRTNTVNGSLWYDDDYNVFYDSSQLLNYKNSVVVNKGAEGGALVGIGEKFALGAYFNRGGGTVGLDAVTGLFQPGVTNVISQQPNLGAQTSFSTRRPADFFFGLDYGIKAGLRVTQAYSQNQSIATGQFPNDEMRARFWQVALGVQFLAFDVFASSTIASEYASTLSGVDTKEKVTDYNVGGRVKYETFTGYVVYRRFKQESSSRIKTSIVGAGLGHVTKLTSKIDFLQNAGIYRAGGTDDTAVFTGYTQYVLPLNLALEAEVLSWLTLRTGATYDFWNQTHFQSLGTHPTAPKSKNLSNQGSASFRIGSTVRFERFSLDSAFGTGVATQEATPNLDTRNAGFDSQLFALIAAKYAW